LQFRHLKLWKHGLLCFVSRWERLILKFALQYQAKCLWYSDLCGLLHLTHIEPCTWYVKVVWPHFQQFLHCGISRFMFASYIVAMKLPMLKHLLMRHWALFSLWIFHMSTYIITISTLGNALITHGLEVRVTLLNICMFLIIALTILELTSVLVFSIRYEIPIIFK